MRKSRQIAIDMKKAETREEYAELSKAYDKQRKAEQRGRTVKTKPAAKNTKPGVIATIAAILEKGKPVTQKQILARLAKRFPERKKESMARTIICQLPGRMSKERGMNITRNGNKYSIA